MPPTPSTCLACSKPFAANLELATIPDASKVAFDPVHRRVWRICASCDEWNLLGPEAAVAALPELEARLRSFYPDAKADQGFAPARVSGKLELLRVGSKATDDTALRLRAEVDKRKKLLRYMWPLCALLFVAWLIVTWPGARVVAVYSLLFFGFAQVDLVTMLSKRWRGEEIPTGKLIMTAVAVVASGIIVYVTSQPGTFRYSLIGFLAIAPIIFFSQPLVDRFVMKARFKLADGSKGSMTQAAVRQVTMSWTSGQSGLTLHDVPPGSTQTGSHVAAIYQRIYGWAARDVTAPDLRKLPALNEGAYQLLNTVGGLPGLLHALEGFRREQDGRVLLSELPMVYLIAIDLALTAEAGGGKSGDVLREKALEAGEVAAIAEGLHFNSEGKGEMREESGENREDG